ncbi:MAG: hypothetical protein Kow00121_49870 [Elainellaceae cyanobacterium]
MDSALPFKNEIRQRNSQLPLILAVDDDDDNLLLISYVLETFGCQCISQTDGEAALAIAKEHRPDLVLLDILLPNVDGIEFVHRLRQDSMTADIPVVAVTALARSEDRQTILLSGFTDYISKPYMLEDLEAVIRRYV